VRDLDLVIARGDRLGIVGPNGVGKTTLLKLLTGELAPDSGRVTLGANVVPVTLDQRREAVPPETPLAAALTPEGGDRVMVGGQPRHVMSYLKDFLFSPAQARTPVGTLSGGERGRLMLARVFARAGNLLILDEPTNDLDLETLDLLQEAVADYPGTVIVVSHDRDFLDRTVTSVLAAEGDGRWLEYAGGWSDMMAQRRGATPSLAPTAGRPAARALAPPPPPRSPAKLSFKEKHRLETLPAEIDRLGREIAALEARLADPDLFAREPQGFALAARDLEAARERLGKAEEEWLDLELKREALEARA